MKSVYLSDPASNHGQADPQTQPYKQNRIKWSSRIQPKTSVALPNKYPTMATHSIFENLESGTVTKKSTGK